MRWSQQYVHKQLLLHSLPQREPLSGCITQDVPGLEPGHPATPSCAYLMAKSLCGLKITFACLKHSLGPYSSSVVMWSVVSKADSLSGSGVHITIHECSDSPFKKASSSNVKKECFSHLFGNLDKTWLGQWGMEACVALWVMQRIGMPHVALEWQYFESCDSSSAEKPETSAGLHCALHHYILVITGRRARIYIDFFKAGTLKWSKHKQCVYAVSGLPLHSFICFAS